LELNLPHPVNIYLVRHATSAANLDKEVYKSLPDFGVHLAPHGHDQAEAAGDFLASHMCDLPDNRFRMLVSPYRRTRETAAGLQKAFDKSGMQYDYREELALREISFGLFDGIPDDELSKEFPLEYAHYKKHVDFEGEFYAPMPLGESRAQVADRVKTVFGTILRDVDCGIPNFVVVSHGVTIRAFVMQWMHYSPEWYSEQSNPDNASIIRIYSDGTHPYRVETIFKGFSKHQTAQDIREDRGVE
jgi:2,3-bisphosphoglycerate-dependent phosphoglycerate mutase